MKKVYYFLSVMLALMVGTTATWADVVDNYTYDFNTPFGATNSSGEYTDHSAAPDGWAHIPEGYDLWGSGSLNYVSYRYYDSYGRDGSGCLYADKQHKGNRDLGTEVDLKDLLVTPKVTGKMSVYAKLYSNSGSVKFYKITEKAGAYVIGDEITPDVNPELNTNDYQAVEIDGLNNERVGIRVSYAFIDDFSADKAEISYKPSALITGKSNMSTYHDVDDEGNYTLSWKVVLENNGKVDIPADTYLLYLVQGGDTLKTLPIPAIAVGEKSDSITVDYPVNIKDYPNSGYRFSIIEGASGNIYEPSSITLVAAKPVLKVYHQGYTELKNGATVDFGTRKNTLKYAIRLNNDGGRALTIQSVSLPEGFSANKVAPLTVAPHTTDTITVAMDSASVGVKDGDFKLVSADTTAFGLHFIGSTLPQDVWYVDFDDNTIPSTFVAGKWTPSYYPQSAYIDDNKYAVNAGKTASKLITPKLEFASGQKLYFDAASASNAGSYGSSTQEGDLKVYYSLDRKDWALIAHFSADAVDESRQLSKVPDSRYGYYYLPKPYALDVPAGQFYIAFEGTNVYLDNIAGGTEKTETHDLYITSSTIPTSTNVNSTINASVSVQNLGVAEDANSYKAQFVVGDEVVDTAAAVAIGAGSTVNYSFKYTAHEAGTYKAYVILSGDNFSVATDAVDLTVAPESAESVVRIGKTDTNWNGDVETTHLPVYGNYHKSQTEIILRPSDLNFGKDTKIKAIAFRGINSLKSTFNIVAKIGNSETNRFSYPYEFSDTASMKTIYDGDYTFNTAEDTTEVLSIQLAEPFVYDGTNLHLFFDNTCKDEGTSLWFEKNDNGNPSIYRNTRNDSYSDDDDPYGGESPIVYLTIEQSPKTLSGTVTSKATGKGIAGATVTLKAGDVVYTDKTDENGKYDITVFKYDNTYDLTIDADGYMPYAKAGVSVKDESKVENVVLADAKGLYIAASNIPATATVNNEYTATATVKNVEASTIAASAYTATLVIGNDKVQAQTKDIAAGESADFTFNYTPHADGTVKAYINFNVKDDAETTTDTVNVVIAQEKTEGIYQVGDSTGFDSQQRSPVNFFYDSSISETIFPAEKIDIPAGANVSRVFFKGYASGSGLTSHVRVYIANTTDPVFTDNGSYGKSDREGTMADTTAMTKVYDGSYTISGSMGSQSSPVIVFDIPFSENFQYTGNNIRLIVMKESSSYMNVSILSDSNYPKASYMQYDDVKSFAELESQGWYQRYMPVAFFEAENKTTFSGVVTDADNNPVADATVTLTAGNVVYSGTTDENGNFSIVVAQADKDYTLTASADGFKSYTATETVSLAAGDAEQNITLEKDPTGIISINGETAEGQKAVSRYNVNGQKVSASQKGVQIVRFADGTTRKVIVK